MSNNSRNQGELLQATLVNALGMLDAEDGDEMFPRVWPGTEEELVSLIKRLVSMGDLSDPEDWLGEMIHEALEESEDLVDAEVQGYNVTDQGLELLLDGRRTAAVTAWHDEEDGYGLDVEES